METWLESVVVVEGSTTKGMGIAVWTEIEGMGAPAVDMVNGIPAPRVWLVDATSKVNRGVFALVKFVSTVGAKHWFAYCAPPLAASIFFSC